MLGDIMRWILGIFIVCFMLSALPANAKDAWFDRGLRAYENQQYKKALSAWKRSARAENLTAMYNIGLLYERGSGVSVSLTSADKWYRKAAVNGHVDAQYRLANLLIILGKKDEAVDWYQRAGKAGNLSAQYNLGLLYLRGKHVEKNLDKAFSWMKMAAEAGDVDAAFVLGQFYYNGYGVAKSKESAMEWFRHARAAGHAKAAEILSQLDQ